MAGMKIVRGKRVRVTKLGACGTPPDYTEDCAYIVTKGFVTATFSPQYAEGEEIEQLNADGELCVSQQSRHNFKRWLVSIELCDVDPELVMMMTKVAAEEDAEGEIVGFRSRQGIIDNDFAFELWSGLGDQPSCEEGEQFGYLLFPYVSGGTFADLTVENGVANLTIENAFTQAGGAWGVGPYDVVADEQGDPAPLASAIASDEHHLQRLTTIAPPDPTDGCGPAAA